MKFAVSQGSDTRCSEEGWWESVMHCHAHLHLELKESDMNRYICLGMCQTCSAHLFMRSIGVPHWDIWGSESVQDFSQYFFMEGQTTQYVPSHPVIRKLDPVFDPEIFCFLSPEKHWMKMLTNRTHVCKLSSVWFCLEGGLWREVLKVLPFLREGNPESCHLWETTVGAEQKGDSNRRALAYQQRAQQQSTEDNDRRGRLGGKEARRQVRQRKTLLGRGVRHIGEPASRGRSNWQPTALMQSVASGMARMLGWGRSGGEECNPNRVGSEEETVEHRTCFGGVCRVFLYCFLLYS